MLQIFVTSIKSICYSVKYGNNGDNLKFVIPTNKESLMAKDEMKDINPLPRGKESDEKLIERSKLLAPLSEEQKLERVVEAAVSSAFMSSYSATDKEKEAVTTLVYESEKRKLAQG